MILTCSAFLTRIGTTVLSLYRPIRSFWIVSFMIIKFWNVSLRNVERRLVSRCRGSCCPSCCCLPWWWLIWCWYYIWKCDSFCKGIWFTPYLYTTSELFTCVNDSCTAWSRWNEDCGGGWYKCFQRKCYCPILVMSGSG